MADAAEAMRAVAENDGLRAMAGELQFARQEKCALEGKVAQLGERVEQLRAKLAAGE